MEQLLSGSWNSGPVIALAAIALANLVIWLKGGAWTPQKRAVVGILAVLVVFGVGYWASPEAYPQTRQGVVNLVVSALVLVLAAAGAPVYKEAFITGRREEEPPAAASEELPQELPPENTENAKAAAELAPVRTWGVWSRRQ